VKIKRTAELELWINVIKTFALKSAKKLNERIETEVMDTDWKTKTPGNKYRTGLD
jgi:hypothetical protein